LGKFFFSAHADQLTFKEKELSLHLKLLKLKTTKNLPEFCRRLRRCIACSEEVAYTPEVMKVESASSNFGIVHGSTLQSISGLIGNGGGGSGPKPAVANRHPAAARPSNGTAAAEGPSDA
jgi:hypothetical protein